MKPLSYITTDPLNAERAEALASRFGLDLEVVEPRDLPRLERERADLIVDWDGLPADYRARLTNGTTANVVAIHGYHLGDPLASFLPRRGILCSPRLDARLLEALTGGASAA